jgi:hypothetical protein|nr:MAG TPA: hypothetical protein [Caudoviricetes sp.]
MNILKNAIDKALKNRIKNLEIDNAKLVEQLKWCRARVEVLEESNADSVELARQHVLLSNKEQLLIAERKALDEYQKHLLDLAIFKRDAQ